MILAREDVKELARAGSLELVVDKAPAHDKLQAVQLTVGTPAVAQVRVIDTWPHRTGGTVVVIELVKRLDVKPKPRKRVERVRLMKARRGTTTDPRQAMRDSHDAGPPDETGVPHPNLVDAEPEMVDEGTEARFASRAHQSHALRELDRTRRELTARLDRSLEGAERLGVDPTRHVAAIERRIKDLEKQVKKAA